MLTEEAHHMFVGETGVGRVVQRTCELMREHRTDDVRQHGGIDLPTIQKYLNFHYSVSLDLFGSEVSTNAANFYTAGLKGRFEETQARPTITSSRRPPTACPSRRATASRCASEPALPALNERLRDDYIADCAARRRRAGTPIIRRHGIDVELRLPHRGFHRAIGGFGELRVSPDGRVVSQAEWDARQHEWLPTAEDYAHVASLMKPVVEPGKFAGWIAPPARGINGQPIEFEYVRLVGGDGSRG